jgi:hypothetical protein
MYTLTNGTYAASITAANFSVSNLPPGLTAGTATRTSSTVVTVPITGTPTAADPNPRTVTLPMSIPAANVTGAGAAIVPTGTVTASAIAAEGTSKNVDAKFRFTGGDWIAFPSGATVAGAASLGVNTFTVTGASISFTGVFTDGGGNLGGFEWEYLYDGSGKIGVVLTVSNVYIYAYLGKSTVEDDFGSDFITADMQDTVNGYTEWSH